MPGRPWLSSSALVIALVCCSIVYGLHQTAVILTSHMGHDQAWYLIAAGRVMGGATLYGPYVSDTNPPMVVWFSMLPVLLSYWLSLSAMLCLRLIVLALLLVSMAWCLHMLKWLPGAERTGVRAWIALGILYAGLRVPPMDFGQREHLFLILALPYLFGLGTRTIERVSIAERCAMGAAAGLAVCLKPQQALALVAAELVIAFGRRSLRRLITPEVLTMAAVCGAYLLAVRTATPAYTKQVVPLLLDTYWAYGTSSVQGLLLGVKFRVLAALLVLGAALALHRSRPLVMLTATLAAASLGAMVAYALQRTDWPYHRAPSSAFLILSAVVCVANLLVEYLPRWERYALKPGIPVAGLVVAALLGLSFFSLQRARKEERSDVYRVLKGQKEPGTVFVFSTTVGWMADVFDLGWDWGGRYPCLAFFPAVALNEQGVPDEQRPFRRLSPERLRAISAMQREDVAEDLDHFQPSVVMVERCDRDHDCQAIEGRTVDTLGWFLKDARFANAWSHYRKRAAGAGPFDVYARLPS